MMAFRRSSEAVQFAVDFSENTGVDYIGIRVGNHSGEVEIRENDIYGLNVNFASRVQHVLLREGIVATERVKTDYERRLGMDSGVRFVPRDEDLKSFGKQTVYSVATRGLRTAIRKQREARFSLLKPNEGS